MKLKLPRVSERQEQAAIVKLLRSLGGQVYVIGTTRRAGDFQGTMQTPGMPDLIAFLPPHPRMEDVRPVLLFVEVKATGGRMRPEQLTFLAWCERAEVTHLVGNVDHVLTWLRMRGYVQ